jgi:hypothetical protein
MSTVNPTPFIRTSRNFPQDPQALSVEINRSYVDIANAVNFRIIGIFPANVSAQTGESWFLTSNRQLGFRQVYTFTSAGNIPHGINFLDYGPFVKIYGTFTDGSIWYPLPYVDTTAANNQINVVVNSTNIVITAGAGSPPSIVSGTIVLEWISQG